MPHVCPNDMIQDVADFHTCAAPYSPMSNFPAEVGFPPGVQMAHCLSLVKEEYTKIVTAEADRNLPGLVSGYFDTMYVCLQGLYSLGLTPEEIHELWEAVHWANMYTVDPRYGLLTDNDYKPYQTDTGEFAKPPGFVPRDITGLLNKFRKERLGTVVLATTRRNEDK